MSLLAVGLSCVDAINVVESYPTEDSDQRGIKYYWQRGGNASNNSTVFSLLSIPCDFMGVLPEKGIEAQWMLDDFVKSNINISNSVMKSCECAVSSCTISVDSGTRTIIFFPRDQPELTFDEFEEKIGHTISKYKWIHFEMRPNTAEVSQMIDFIVSYNNVVGNSHEKILLSVEIEKPEIETNESVKKCDFIFVGKDYVTSKGLTDPEKGLQVLLHLCSFGSTLVLPWGSKGVWCHHRGNTVYAPALDIKAVDTLGAGDTFTAGFIGFLWYKSPKWTRSSLSQQVLQEALDFGCQLAGHKCAMFGFCGLSTIISKLFSKFEIG